MPPTGSIGLYPSLMADGSSKAPLQVELDTVWVNTDCTKLFPLPLAGTDRMMNVSIDVSHFVPGRFDDKQLISALRSTLDYYPHVIARLRINGDDWWLDAGKRGIPVRFQTTEEPLNLHPDLSTTPTGIIDSVSNDLSRAGELDWDEPLVQIKVTYCSKTNESVIGFSYSHILGDGDLIIHFLGAWSQYYQGKEPLLGRPTYEKYQIPQPPGEINDNPETDVFLARHLHYLKEILPLGRLMEMKIAAEGLTTFLDLSFSSQQLEQLRYVADSWVAGSGGSAKRTTPQDALGAYFITTMNRCLDVPITRVISTITSRGIKNPDDVKPGDWRSPGQLAAGNNVLHAYTPTLSTEEACSIGAVAAAMRKSVKEARQYKHAKRIYAIANPISLRIAKEQTFYKFWDDGVFCWNAMGSGRSDGDSFHFGFGHARFNTYGTIVGNARCFQGLTVRQLDDNFIVVGRRLELDRWRTFSQSGYISSSHPSANPQPNPQLSLGPGPYRTYKF
ncbi:hypothetical protein FB45DRAFT_1136359 [Roridomyces roridus]|uniref:Uncharacterized protein n=1 Tax=Roridomyces roridus TaxID=1738132 RepID=A0AAD7B142_9AGAR|nr:hypothetical protein FB45DRAFT_1136359 [Roridomyces roridus]